MMKVDVELAAPSENRQISFSLLPFTGKEFDILLLLMQNPNVVFSRAQIYDSVWGMDSYGDTATVTVHLNRIREKIEDDSTTPKYLQTIWGAGYRFRT